MAAAREASDASGPLEAVDREISLHNVRDHPHAHQLEPAAQVRVRAAQRDLTIESGTVFPTLALIDLRSARPRAGPLPLHLNLHWLPGVSGGSRRNREITPPDVA